MSNVEVALFSPRFTWTRDAPVHTGWYWHRSHGGPAMIALVFKDDGEDGALSFESPGAYGCMVKYKLSDVDWFEWAGPIPRPDNREGG